MLHLKYTNSKFPLSSFQSPRNNLKWSITLFFKFSGLHTGIPTFKKIYLLITYFVAFQFKKLKLHRYPVLGWRDHLPHTVFIRRVLFGPSWSGDGAIKLGEKATTSS